MEEKCKHCNKIQEECECQLCECLEYLQENCWCRADEGSWEYGDSDE